MKKIISLLIAVIFVSSMTLSVFAENMEVVTDLSLGFTDVYYIDENGYDVQDNSTEGDYSFYPYIWYFILSDNKKEYTLAYNQDILTYLNCKVRVPDSCAVEKKNSKKYITAISWSCPIKAFDLNPENKYMKLIDNVVFSKDGKKLMSYAQGDERTFYEIPVGTELIGEYALWGCSNIKEISMPDSVKEIHRNSFGSMKELEKVNISSSVNVLHEGAFWTCDKLKEINIPENSELRTIGEYALECDSLTELTLPSFDIEISNTAFGEYAHNLENLSLKSYVKPEVKAFYSRKTNTYKLKWDKIPNASRYEVYQKLSDGSYKLIKETSKNSISFKNIKSGKRYTFAVKPIAEIKAIEDDEHSEIEYYTIEGTMSEECSFRGK